jgi:hypothetical protein
VSGGASRAEEVQDLAARAAVYASRASGEGTHRAYRAAWQAFARWFEGLGREAPTVWRRLASDLDLRKLDELTKDVALTDVIQAADGRPDGRPGRPGRQLSSAQPLS